MVSYLEELPEVGFTSHIPCLIYDRYLEHHLKSWLCQLEGVHYPVRAGEDLKSIDSFPTHIKAILEKTKNIPRKQLVVISLGGGSVGDFAGFVASTLKRGVRLIHIPSTWLSAIDSAHGGKTALNVGPYKNQVGSFYWPKRVIICRSLLQTLSISQTRSAMGELCKMALIAGGDLYHQFKETKDWDFESIWNLLPQVVQMKYQIVDQDPREQNGLREKLNLGHTLGHILETSHGIPHGEAVAQGLWFAIHWSHEKFQYSDNQQLHQVLLQSIGPQKSYKLMEFQLRQALLHDKKLTSPSHINFIFVEAPGDVKVQNVSIDSLVREAKRQNWIAHV